MNIREQIYQKNYDPKKKFFLGADIGGTNSNFGFFQIQNQKPILILSTHLKSQEIIHFEKSVQQMLDYVQSKYQISAKHGCFAAAGVVTPTRDYCKPTNLRWALRSDTLLKKTNLECAVIANDFEVIGHGLPVIDPTDITQVKAGDPVHHANRVIIGAGTGLGMCMLRWDFHSGRYIPLASEGGHTDFAPQDSQQWELVRYITNKENRKTCVSWEDVLSGYGIQRIYQFFSSHKKHRGNGPQPDEIFKTRHDDQASFNTYTLYARLYAQCARNSALMGLALGGVYIAGGIATHNVDLFKSESFGRIFVANQKEEPLLKIPIFVIKDYNVSLYGAVEFMRLELLCG